MKAENSYRNHVVGVDTLIPLINGTMVKAINFDNAATTPPFSSALQAVLNFSPWYASIHRGMGYKSQYSSHLYERARVEVAKFVKADLATQAVIFLKNTTEAINKVSYRLYKKKEAGVILSSCMEHHSNDLPWRDKYLVDYIALDEKGRLSIHDLEKKLIKYGNRVKLVAITGASNVTGYRNPVHQIAALAHKHGAKILVDGAQLIPHAPFDVKSPDSSEHIDYLVFSAHKMYAPFGVGVLIGPKASFKDTSPDYQGGGTVDLVTHDFIRWTDPPRREEAGTPNVMGVVALVEAIRTLTSIGMDQIDRYETELLDYATEAFKKIPDIELLCKDTENRVAILPFNISDMPHWTTAMILSYEGGIAVRNGCFCAQPYVQRLLNISQDAVQERIDDPHAPHPGVVRISFGLYNTFEEVDRFLALVHQIVSNKDEYLNKYRYVSPPIF